MTYLEAKNLVEMVRFQNAWDNANPYDGICDEERCVKGKKCKECNEGVDDE